MSLLSLRLLACLALCSLFAATASAADIVSYRARYSLTLASTRASSGVVAAGGAMTEEWAETCDGWTEQQHFYLHLAYDDEPPGADSFTNYYEFVSWEAKDGQRYQFDMRQATSDHPYQEVKGEAKLAGGARHSGMAEFARPESTTLSLPPGVTFPAAYLRLVLARAQAGDHLVTRDVFDGSAEDNAGQVTAAIGPRLAPAKPAQDVVQLASPLLNRPSWRIAFAFFPSDHAVEMPEYEESVRLLDNGVLEDMVFDYGDYAIGAKLEDIEALPQQHCR
jgi:hypothetical protein